MTSCYLTDLPLQFMRGIAGFEPDYASNYFIPRDTVKPPLSLRQRVWPDLDRWRQAHLGLPGSIEAIEPNLAAGGFLELLDKLRDVFLQDSVFLRRDYPFHPLFIDGLFASPEYANFATAVLAAEDRVHLQDPHVAAIEKAVNEQLQSMMDMIQTGQAAHEASLARIRSSLDEISRKLDIFLTGTFTLTIPSMSGMVFQGYDPATGQPRRQTTLPN
jgi:hypothetical protein